MALPNGPGKAAVQRACGGTCHTLDTVTSLRRDRQAWAVMVDNMVARGAVVKDDDVQPIVDYLATYFGR